MLPIIGGVLAAVVLGGFAVTAAPRLTSRSSSDVSDNLPEPEPVKIDISIPYDAAAMLAYREKLGISESDAIDRDDYEKFKALYEEATVADVIVKKKQRELDAMLEQAKAKAAELDAIVAKN